jgi:hypothetical protein
MSLYSKNVSVKLAHKYTAGTNAGATSTLPVVTGKRIYLESINGFNDAATIIEVRNDLTGTVATANTDETVTGTGTLFTKELEVGDTVRIQTTNEILIVDSITSDTSFEATVASGNTASGKVCTRLVAEFKPSAAGNINIQVGGGLYSSTSRALDVVMLASTADCALTAVGYTL